MTNSFLAQAKKAALLPFAIGASLIQAGCSPVTKNGELSENSLLYVLGMFASSILYCLGDAMRNHSAAARIAEHDAVAKKLAKLEAGENQPPVILGQPIQPRKETEQPVRHYSDRYKPWNGVPGLKSRPIGRDEPERAAPVFKTWDEAIGGRRFTNSFGRDSPSVYYKTMADAAAHKNGAPAKILWR